MNYLKKLPIETKIRFISEFIIKLVSFSIIPIITYSIGIQEYGKYIVITCIINGLLPILLLGFNFSIVKKLASNNDIINNSVKIFNSFTLISFFTTFILLTTSLVSFFFFKHLFKINILVVLVSYITVSQQLFFEFLRSKEKSNSFCYFQSFDSIFLIISLLITFTMTQLSLIKLLSLISLTKIICIFFILIYLFQVKLLNTKFFKLDRNIFKNYIVPGLVFICLGFSEWLINFGDKIILSYYLEPLYLSIYFTAGMFAAILNSIGSIFWWDLYPKLVKFDKSKSIKKIYSTIRSKNILFVDFSIFVIIFLITMSPIIQYFLLNSEFKVNYYLYLIFFLSVFTHQISTGWEFFCYINNKEKFILLNSIVWGVLSFILYFITIPYLKIEGALISLFISKFGYSLSLMNYAKKIGFNESILNTKIYFKFILFFLSFAFFLILKNFSIFNIYFDNMIYFLIIMIFFYSTLKLCKNFL